MGSVQALQSPRDEGAGVGRGRVWDGARATGGSRGLERERERSDSRGREAARSGSRGREAAGAGSRGRDWERSVSGSRGRDWERRVWGSRARDCDRSVLPSGERPQDGGGTNSGETAGIMRASLGLRLSAVASKFGDSGDTERRGSMRGS